MFKQNTGISMNFDDLKVYGLNTVTLAVSFSVIEDAFKLLLIIVSIGYTLEKWYIMRTKNKNEDE